jgi:hypothetical protein
MPAARAASRTAAAASAARQAAVADERSCVLLEDPEPEAVLDVVAAVISRKRSLVVGPGSIAPR